MKMIQNISIVKIAINNRSNHYYITTSLLQGLLRTKYNKEIYNRKIIIYKALENKMFLFNFNKLIQIMYKIISIIKQ